MYQPENRQTQQGKQAPLIVGNSPQAWQMRNFAQLAAENDHTVLILGEMGTGKDHLAAYIHALGREGQPFVMVDCGTLTASLTETELFGHTKGAYTDAKEARTGLVKSAENGTLFFNEVANMSIQTQAKFLAIVEKKPFRQVGGIKETEVNTRIIAATNANLPALVRTGEFRSDLLYRLDGLTIKVPPLRQRLSDVPELTSHFLEKWGSPVKFSDDAMSVMMGYSWPGNIRQLESVVKKAMVQTPADEEVGPAQVKIFLQTLDEMLEEGDEAEMEEADSMTPIIPTPQMQQAASAKNYFVGGKWATYEEVSQEAEAELTRQVLAHVKWNRARAAKAMGVSYKTMLNKIRLMDKVLAKREDRND
jgi:DNA-binding NtrC family response regulator